jgi:hypothetical protein
VYPTLSDFGTYEPDVLLVSDEPIVTDHVLFLNCSSCNGISYIVHLYINGGIHTLVHA